MFEVLSLSPASPLTWPAADPSVSAGSQIGSPAGLKFQNTNGLKQFQPGDNIVIRSLQVVTCFGQPMFSDPATFVQRIELIWQINGGGGSPLIYSGFLKAYNQVDDLGGGVYAQAASLTEPADIELQYIEAGVSNIGLPVTLSGISLPVFILIGVEHTLPMQ